MSLDALQFVSGALGGALVSATIAPLIAQRHERRDLRANVLRAISHVERTRWAPTNWNEFRDAVVTLRAAALVAAANREVVDYYLVLAQIAYAESTNDFDETIDPDYTGGLDSRFADLVRDAAETLVDHLWRPIRKRRAVKIALAALRAREHDLREDKTIRLQWDTHLL